MTLEGKSTEIKPVEVVDTKGMLCPLPVFKTKQAISRVKADQVIEVLATDPQAENDISSWVTRNGHQLVQLTNEKGILRILIRKR